jgi:transcription elongation factor Elf1
VFVEINREECGQAVAQCSSCGLKEGFQVRPAQSEIDAYCMLTDHVYSALKRTSIAKLKE